MAGGGPNPSPAWEGRPCVSTFRRCWLFGFTATLYLTAPPPTIAQSVHGRVTEEGDRTPIPAARVELLTAQWALAARARTAGDRTYELRAPGPGTYRLRVEEPNHSPLFSEPVTLAEGDSVEVSPALSPLPHLEGFYRRRRLAAGTFFTMHEVDASLAIRASDLIRRFAGFTCSYDDFGSCRISSARSWQAMCPPLVLVDELPMGTALEYDLDLISPAWLGAIEVHTSPSTMPPELKVSGAACGLILLWTLR